MISMCSCAFFSLIIRRSQNTRFLCRTRMHFFPLMTHKSVTCVMFPNKPGVPLTEKIKYTCTFFWRRDLPTFFFLAHKYFTRFVCVVRFPRPSFKFRTEIFIRRAILEFIPPTTSPPSVSPSRLPLPASQTAATPTTASTTSTFCSDLVREPTHLYHVPRPVA